MGTELVGDDVLELPPRVLCVGGLDPTGAAGLLADMKTVTLLGGYASGVVSALTVQTSTEVSDVLVQPASLVGAEFDAALAEYGVDALKTGMLGSVDVVHAVARRLRGLGSSVRLVVDPVLVASSGRSLLDLEGREALVSELLPRAALVTPNLPEAALLSGRTVHTREDMASVADWFLATGAGAVLVKGGHLVDFDDSLEEVSDLLRTADGDEFWFSRPRFAGPPVRGTGCALASAVATLIAGGSTLRDAVERGTDFVARAIREAPPMGRRARPLAFTTR